MPGIVQRDSAASKESAAAAAHARLARLLAASGRIAQAKRHCAAALTALDADDSDSRWQVLFELALVHARLRDHAQAVGLLTRAVAIEPGAAETHANLAAQLMIEGDLDAAHRHCETALALAPQYPEAHFNMNVLLRRAGRQQEAIERYWGLVEAEVGLRLRPLPAGDRSGGDTLKHLQDSRLPVAAGSKAPAGVSVLCVKWGTKYGAEYVNKLFASLARNAGGADLQVEFVCLTDDASGVSTELENQRCLPLEPGWKGWWNKLQVFSPRVAAQLRFDRCVFLDLDTVVVASLTELLRWEVPQDELALLRTDTMANEQRRGGYNSSVMMWRRDHDSETPSFQHVYDLLHAHFSSISKFIYKFDHWLEMALPRVIFLDDVFPGVIVEFRSLGETAPMPPPTASIVCFPLQPKPHDARAAWIQRHWR